MRLWVARYMSALGLVLLAGCTAAAAPTVETPTPAPVTLVVRSRPTDTPTAAATPAEAVALTPVPPRAPTLPVVVTPRATLTVRALTATPQPTEPGVEPSPDPTRAAQQAYCDAASPGAHLPLPPALPVIRISPAQTASQATPAIGGPRREREEPPPTVTAKHVAVLDDASGALLLAQDAYARQAPASVTKIVTAIVALEHVPDISTVYTTTVSSTALVACDGSSVMGLEPNDHVRLETLLYGMLLPSGNDAAEQVAMSLAGSRERYVEWMNEKVRSLRLTDTHFVTPSGMDADEHYSSAYDLALLARDAMKNPTFRTIVSTPRFVGDEYYMHNLNPLLGSYPGADGVKIGYTDIAGRTMVASATRDGHRVYVSLLGSRNLAADARALLDWAFASYSW